MHSPSRHSVDVTVPAAEHDTGPRFSAHRSEEATARTTGHRHHARSRCNTGDRPPQSSARLPQSSAPPSDAEHERPAERHQRATEDEHRLWPEAVGPHARQGEGEWRQPEDAQGVQRQDAPADRRGRASLDECEIRRPASSGPRAGRTWPRPRAIPNACCSISAPTTGPSAGRGRISPGLRPGCAGEERGPARLLGGARGGSPPGGTAPPASAASGRPPGTSGGHRRLRWSGRPPSMYRCNSPATGGRRPATPA
jgi:hypothetical protein